MRQPLAPILLMAERAPPIHKHNRQGAFKGRYSIHMDIHINATDSKIEQPGYCWAHMLYKLLSPSLSSYL